MEIFDSVISDEEIIGITRLATEKHRDTYTAMNHHSHALIFQIVTRSNVVRFTSDFFSWQPTHQEGQRPDPQLLLANLEMSEKYNDHQLRYCEVYEKVCQLVGQYELPDYIVQLREDTERKQQETKKRLAPFRTNPASN